MKALLKNVRQDGAFNGRCLTLKSTYMSINKHCDSLRIRIDWWESGKILEQKFAKTERYQTLEDLIHTFWLITNYQSLFAFIF